MYIERNVRSIGGECSVYLHVKGRPGAIGTEDALPPEELSELLAEVEGTTPEAIVEEISDD